MLRLAIPRNENITRTFFGMKRFKPGSMFTSCTKLARLHRSPESKRMSTNSTILIRKPLSEAAVKRDDDPSITWISLSLKYSNGRSLIEYSLVTRK